MTTWEPRASTLHHWQRFLLSAGLAGQTARLCLMSSQAGCLAKN